MLSFCSGGESESINIIYYMVNISTPKYLEQHLGCPRMNVFNVNRAWNLYPITVWPFSRSRIWGQICYLL